MAIVRQILETKGYDVYAVAPDTTIYEALELMAEKNIGAVLVMTDDALDGIFSERDYARKVVLAGKSSRAMPVREAMTETVICVQPNQSVEGCMGLMTDKRIRHLPVLDQEGAVIGVISIGDVVKALISEQANTIHHLESYITTGHPGAGSQTRKVQER
ncbi:MAG: CBS domain-containing protein [Candidatus Promineifilaceae bacterium]|nr:CBS domain-containing protein [Candidatus Promineifilaceae bacterium]